MTPQTLHPAVARILALQMPDGGFVLGPEDARAVGLEPERILEEIDRIPWDRADAALTVCTRMVIDVLEFRHGGTRRHWTAAIEPSRRKLSILRDKYRTDPTNGDSSPESEPPSRT